MTQQHLFITLVNKYLLILFILHPSLVSCYYINIRLIFLWIVTDLASHPQLNNVQLVNYVQKGGNMLIAVSSDVDDNVRALVSEFDIEVETEKVFGHTQFVGEHDLIATTNVIAPASIIEKKHMEAPILYSGAGLTVGNNPFSIAILNAERDAFVAESYQKRADTSHPVTLVGALQARNSARVTVVGSLDLFSDKLISSAVNIDSDHT